MATYINDVSVNAINLDNQSGTVLSLECYYKESTDGTAKRIGSTDSCTVGFSRTLDLNDLADSGGLKDGCWITAYANVKAGKDSYGDVWVKYHSGYGSTANYTISGVINFTKVAFNGAEEK